MNKKTGIIQVNLEPIKRFIKEKLNPFYHLQEYLTNKLNRIRQEWYQYIKDLTGNNPCSTLTNIKVSFGLYGYRIIHLSGNRVIAYRPYFLNGFKLNEQEILKIVFKISKVELDFKRGLVSVDRTMVSMVGKPIGIYIDYNKQQIAFVMSNTELTREFVFGIRSCLNLIKKLEPELFKLVK